MDKKLYIKPEVLVVKFSNRMPLMVGSPMRNRIRINDDDDDAVDAEYAG
jgi:hypothetical protein